MVTAVVEYKPQKGRSKCCCAEQQPGCGPTGCLREGMLVEMGKLHTVITFLYKQLLSSDITFSRKHWELLNNFPDNKPLQSIHIRCWIIQRS